MPNIANGVSKATKARIPAYLRYLKGQALNGVEYISSAAVAEDLGLTAISVRKDLAVLSSTQGKPRVGFEVKRLVADLEGFLGYDRRTDAVIVGAGRLGRAILAYDGFENYGINVLAAFDISPTKVGAVGGKPVYPMERLPEIVARHGVKTGILTVPRAHAQEAGEVMAQAGICAIMNFAPVQLRLPEHVKVEYVDLAVSLAALCNGAENRPIL